MRRQPLSTPVQAGALLWCAALLACGDPAPQATRDATDGGPEAPLELTPADPPFAVQGVTFAADVPCGDYPETRFDIVMPETDQPTPLIVYIHGGGFRGGSKEEPWTDRETELREALGHGFAMASVEYRFLQDHDEVGVRKPLGDCMRCLQTMRYHAAQLNIDPARVALMGTSAGAGTALWLAFHDEQAAPASEDPVARQSTRVQALAVWETQATYDLLRWSTDVFQEYGVDLISIADSLGQSQALLDFYAISSVEELESPEVVAYRQEVDMLRLMDAEDAPFWVENAKAENAFPSTSDIAFHHPRHAMALKERADAVGLENVAYIPRLDYEDPSDETAVGFLARHLRAQPGT